MSSFLKPGTICILTRTPSGADAGRLVEVVKFYGPLKLGPELFSEAYLTRCVAGRPLHSVRQWLANGSYIDHKDKVYTAVADRAQLRPLPGIDESIEVQERTPLEVEG